MVHKVLFLLLFLATAPGQVEDLFGKRKSLIRRSARATLGRHVDSKGILCYALSNTILI